METILKRLERIQDLHKKYSEAVTLQLSNLFDDISKITPLQQVSQDETNDNANSNTSVRRGAPRRSVIVNNNSRAVPNAPRGTFSNSRIINNTFKRPNNENRVPMTRRMNQLLKSSRIDNRPIRTSCTTSKKMRDFSLEPICDKTVDKIPGVGPKAAARLSTLNYVYARRLLGKFLETDKEEFLEFLRMEAEVLPHNAEKTWRSLDDYRINHL